MPLYTEICADGKTEAASPGRYRQANRGRHSLFIGASGRRAYADECNAELTNARDHPFG